MIDVTIEIDRTAFDSENPNNPNVNFSDFTLRFRVVGPTPEDLRIDSAQICFSRKDHWTDLGNVTAILLSGLDHDQIFDLALKEAAA